MSNHTKTRLNPINITNYMINLHIFIKKIYVLNVLFFMFIGLYFKLVKSKYRFLLKTYIFR